jgi:hypothetical protein
MMINSKFGMKNITQICSQISPALFIVVLNFKIVQKIIILLLLIEIKSQLTPSTLQLESLNTSKHFD